MTRNTARAYVIHSFPYQDSKLIIELLTAEYGKISALMRRNKKKPNLVPQPFTCNTVAWRGRSSLKNVEYIDELSGANFLRGRSLYCALYCNELIQKLISDGEGAGGFFHVYQHTIEKLAVLSQHETYSSEVLEPVLRYFELHLINETGFGFDFTVDTVGHAIIDSDEIAYQYTHEQGFSPLGRAASAQASPRALVLTGRHLFQLSSGDFSEKSTRLLAKKLTRLVIDRLLNGQPIKAREFFA